MAIPTVVVMQNYEARSRFVPSPQLPWNALFEILLAFMRHAQKRQPGEQSR